MWQALMELLKADPNTTALIIHPLIERFWNNETLPLDPKEGVMDNISKKDYLTERGNLRGITLLSMVYKIIAHIVINSTYSNSHPICVQSRFRLNGSCVDSINSIRIVVEQSVPISGFY